MEDLGKGAHLSYINRGPISTLLESRGVVGVNSNNRENIADISLSATHIPPPLLSASHSSLDTVLLDLPDTVTKGVESVPFSSHINVFDIN